MFKIRIETVTVLYLISFISKLRMYHAPEPTNALSESLDSVPNRVLILSFDLQLAMNDKD